MRKRGKTFSKCRILASATMVGEKWSVELVFDDGEVERLAEAAKAGATYMDPGFYPIGVVCRTGRGGWPGISWFSDASEALGWYQKEVDRFSGKADEACEEEDENDEW